LTADSHYSAEFFAELRDMTVSSADVVVPLVLEHYRADSVIDVGCGEGWFGKAFADRGCRVIGVDGAYVQERVINFREADLAEPLPPLGSFDLAVCLEVAEHLDNDRGPTFIDELCQLAPTVLFSAAIPGQGGMDHRNEQWPGYWVELFSHNGYTCSAALRWKIWDNDQVACWYRQNLLVASNDPQSLPSLFDGPLSAVWPVVHPELFRFHMAQAAKERRDSTASRSGARGTDTHHPPFDRLATRIRGAWRRTR
jgi:SAM-dependent methyltransferase